MQQPTARAARIARSCAAAILLGCATHDAGAEARQQFTIAGHFVPAHASAGDEGVFTKAIAWAVPISEVAALFDLTPGSYDWSFPGLAVDVWVAPGERSRVEAFSMAWMYVYRQPGVPYFRTPENGTHALRVPHEASLVPAHVWQQAGGDGLLRAIRWLHPSTEIESRLARLRARYDAAVSRWLMHRPPAKSPAL
jgi:hypothetical protein